MEEQPRILGEVSLERLLEIQSNMISASCGPEELTAWLAEQGIRRETFAEFMTLSGEAAAAAMACFLEMEQANPAEVLAAIYAGAFEMGVRFAEERAALPSSPYIEI